MKYSRFFLSKMIKTNLPLVCPLCFFVTFAVLGVLFHYCSSLHKTESRQHTRISTAFNSELQLSLQLRLYDPCIRTNVSFSKILTHYAENEHFPPPIKRPLLVEAPYDIRRCWTRLAKRAGRNFRSGLFSSDRRMANISARGR